MTRDARLFAAGAAIVTLHLVDVVAWRPAVVLALALLAYRFAPATARAAIGLVAAAAAVMGAYLHVLHIRWDGLARTDITGVALFAASALFAAAAVLALLSRRPLRPARRAVRAVATAAAAIPLLLFAVVPVAVAMWLGGKPRQPLEPASLPVAHRDVTLRSSDGNARLAVHQQTFHVSRSDPQGPFVPMHHHATDLACPVDWRALQRQTRHCREFPFYVLGLSDALAIDGIKVQPRVLFDR